MYTTKYQKPLMWLADNQERVTYLEKHYPRVYSIMQYHFPEIMEDPIRNRNGEVSIMNKFLKNLLPPGDYDLIKLVI